MQKCLEMANGDEAFLDKLWEVRKSKEDSQKMSLYPIEEELYYIWMKLFVSMMKRRGLNEYARRISLVFLIGAEIVFWLAAIGFFYSVTDFV